MSDGGWSPPSWFTDLDSAIRSNTIEPLIELLEKGPRDFIVSNVATWIVGIILGTLAYLYSGILTAWGAYEQLPIIVGDVLAQTMETFSSSTISAIISVGDMFETIVEASGPLSFLVAAALVATILILVSWLIRLLIRVIPFL